MSLYIFLNIIIIYLSNLSNNNILLSFERMKSNEGEIIKYIYLWYVKKLTWKSCGDGDDSFWCWLGLWGGLGADLGLWGRVPNS